MSDVMTVASTTLFNQTFTIRRLYTSSSFILSTDLEGFRGNEPTERRASRAARRSLVAAAHRGLEGTAVVGGPLNSRWTILGGTSGHDVKF